MNGGSRIRRVVALVVLASVLSMGADTFPVEAAEESLRIPDYTGWRLEEEATTYRPGTDLRFYALELRSYANPTDPADKVVELRRHDALYILYHYAFTKDGTSWEIYMDAGASPMRPAAFSTPMARPPGATSGSTSPVSARPSESTSGHSDPPLGRWRAVSYSRVNVP